MKIKNYIKTAVLVLTLATLSGCEKFLDVRPKTQVREDHFFENERGFQEALNGIYLNMGNPNLYGRSLTFGFVDALAGMYIENGMTNQYLHVFGNNYTDAGVQNFTSGIWLTAYNNIANLNNLLTKMEAAGRTLFTGDNYDMIRGEALGLRAMLHFDLLRIFGTSIVNGGNDLPAIPYRTEYDAKVVGKMTGRVVMEHILEDLLEAEMALQVDPIIESTIASRKLRMNYYAVKGIQARYHLWNNDPEKARLAAEEVIESERFAFVGINAVLAEDPNKNRVFTTEHLLGIYSPDILTNYTNLLTPTGSATGLIINDQRLEHQYEVVVSGGAAGGIGATDIRYRFLIQRLAHPSNLNVVLTYFGKLYQPQPASTTFGRRIPVMKIPEMYYIAAECLKDTDPEQAIAYLNTVRAARSITETLPSTLSSAEIQAEIQKEYWKEMPLEGQMFYYYKRTNSLSIPGKVDTFDLDLYTIPLPPTEIEYGF